MDNLPRVEDVVKKNIFIYDIDIEEGDFVGELIRRNSGKQENTVTTLFTPKTSKTSSNASDAQLAIHFSIYLKISTSICYDAKTESKTLTL